MNENVFVILRNVSGTLAPEAVQTEPKTLNYN